MMSLVSFIQESRKIFRLSPLCDFINENTGTVPRYLIGKWSEKTKYGEDMLLSGEEFWDASNEMQKLMTKDQLKSIFDWGESHTKNMEIAKRPEPLVANYGGKVNGFAFRRWVIDAVKELGIKIPAGRFHNTSLKSGGWTPSAQDMEDVIATSYNVVTGTSEDIDYDVIEPSPGVRMDKIENILSFYKNHSDTFNEIASKLIKSIGSIPPLGKLATEKNSVTDKWKELNGGHNVKGTTNTPKTDIISYDKDGNTTTEVRISLKSAVGSQLMSGNFYESKSTIMSALETTKLIGDSNRIKDFTYDRVKEIADESDNNVVMIVNAIQALLTNNDMPKWFSGKVQTGVDAAKKDESHPQHNEIIEAETSGKVLEKLLKKLIKKKPEFCTALLHEAISGEVKFGKDSKSSANYVLVWNETNPEKSDCLSIDGYIEHIQKTQKITITIRFKSSAGKDGSANAWQVLGIICGKGNNTEVTPDNIKKDSRA